MARTPSTMIPLGTTAPDFTLLDTRSKQLMGLNELKSPVATVILFLCNHCPYVKLIQAKLVEIANKYQQMNVSFIAISSNDAEKYPDDSPEKMREEALNNHYPFPYLYDESQVIAKAYQAACTPDVYIFDGNLACVYRGRFDEATPGNGLAVTGHDLSSALDNIIAGKPVSAEQIPSIGCNIKWKN